VEKNCSSVSGKEIEVVEVVVWDASYPLAVLEICCKKVLGLGFTGLTSVSTLSCRAFHFPFFFLGGTFLGITSFSIQWS